MHNLIMESRKKLNLSGIKDCKSFEDDLVVLLTEMGELSIKGESLHIDSFSVETGDLIMNGTIFAIVYTNDEKTRGFFSRIFK